MTIATVDMKVFEEPHMPACCRRSGRENIVDLQTRLHDIARRTGSALAQATMGALRLTEQMLAGEEIPEAARLHVLALEQEARDFAELERRAPKMIERGWKAYRAHHQACADEYFQGLAAQLDALFTDTVRVIAGDGLDLAKLQALADMLTVHKTVALRWASSAGYGSALPPNVAPLCPVYGPNVPAIDALGLHRLVVTHPSFAARLAAITTGG